MHTIFVYKCSADYSILSFVKSNYVRDNVTNPRPVVTFSQPSSEFWNILPAVGFQMLPRFLLTLSDRITVCQTLNPYIHDIQYIALHVVTLEPNGTISLGKPGDNFEVVCHEFTFWTYFSVNHDYRSYRVKNSQAIHFQWLPHLHCSPTFFAQLKFECWHITRMTHIRSWP